MAGSEISSPDSAEVVLAAGQDRRTLAEAMIQIGGLILSVVLAALSALLEALYSSAFIGAGQRAPWSVLGAVVGNIFLVWFARYTVRRTWAPVVPALTWVLVMLVATYRTSEGDVLMTDNNPVSLATLIAGFVTLVIAWYAPAIKRRRA